MTTATGTGHVDQELREAIASAALSDALLTRAKGIMAQIERPVRLAVLGLPGSGKTTLINLLAGATVVPAGLRLPSMQLTHGMQPLVKCTLPDGDVQIVDGLNMADVAALNPIFLNVELPLPALAKISMLEVVAKASVEEQSRALMWASKRSDIALWCSENMFDEAEQNIWSVAPDETQDHGLMVLTKSDRMGDMRRRVDHLTAKHGYAFKRVLGIDAQSAIQARRKDGSVDKEALRASGGLALISAILKDVDFGRQAARDQAEVFLHQIDYEPAPAPAPAHTLKAVAPKTPVVAPVIAAPIVASKPAPVSVPAAQPVVVKLTLAEESKAVCVEAVGELEAQNEALAQALIQGQVDGEEVLATCLDTIGWLSDYLSNNGAANDPVMQDLRETSMDASDLMQLIELETGDTMTTDALSLMVQLREEMQAQIAA
ncbi:MAG: hypothetical protein ABJL99_14695 [Aliishimia sp.]